MREEASVCPAPLFGVQCINFSRCEWHKFDVGDTYTRTLNRTEAVSRINAARQLMEVNRLSVQVSDLPEDLLELLAPQVGDRRCPT